MMRWLVFCSIVACNRGYEDTSVPPTTTLDETGTNGSFPTPDAVTDTFTQIPFAPVDLLVVIDNSTGMGGYQSQLADAYGSLIRPYFDAGIDVQVGFVSTDVAAASEHGRLHQLSDSSRWIDAQTTDPEGVFRAAVAMGEGGDHHTEGITATELALDPVANPDNAGFLRETARLEVLVLSNHDDANDTLVFTDTLTLFHSYKSVPAKVRFSAAVEFPGCTCGGGGIVGAKYGLLQAALFGDAFDLEGGTWATDLAAIPARNDLLTHSFALSGTPDPTTIAITVDGVAPDPTIWQYAADANAVLFNFGDEPTYSSTIEITWVPAGT